MRQQAWLSGLGYFRGRRLHLFNIELFNIEKGRPVDRSEHHAILWESA